MTTTVTLYFYSIAYPRMLPRDMFMWARRVIEVAVRCTCHAGHSSDKCSRLAAEGPHQASEAGA